MEIADNQHPIDLSRKCAFYQQSYTKSIPASRPPPPLIPISVIGSRFSSDKHVGDDLSQRFNNAFSSSSTDPNDFQFKEQSKFRKELSRFRSVPHLPKNAKISRLKSKSDSKICSLTDTRPFSSAYVPIYEYANVNRNERGKNQYYSSFANNSPIERNYCWKPPDDREVTSSMHSISSKHVKQGPGVSVSTIQSLRKLLDKRKSMHRDE